MAQIIPLPRDAWQTEDDGYSPYKYYSRSVDSNGHGVDVRTKIPPDLHSQISRLLAKNLIPEYQSMADFIRDAVNHRSKWLAENVVKDPAFDLAISQHIQQVEMQILTQARAMRRQQLLDIRTGLEELVQDEDWEGVCEILNKANVLLDSYTNPHFTRMLTLIYDYTELVPPGWQCHLDT